MERTFIGNSVCKYYWGCIRRALCGLSRSGASEIGNFYQGGGEWVLGEENYWLEAFWGAYCNLGCKAYDTNVLFDVKNYFIFLPFQFLSRHTQETHSYVGVSQAVAVVVCDGDGQNGDFLFHSLGLFLDLWSFSHLWINGYVFYNNPEKSHRALMFPNIQNTYSASCLRVG